MSKEFYDLLLSSVDDRVNFIAVIRKYLKDHEKLDCIISQLFEITIDKYLQEDNNTIINVLSAILDISE